MKRLYLEQGLYGPIGLDNRFDMILALGLYGPAGLSGHFDSIIITSSFLSLIHKGLIPGT